MVNVHDTINNNANLANYKLVKKKSSLLQLVGIIQFSLQRPSIFGPRVDLWRTI